VPGPRVGNTPGEYTVERCAPDDLLALRQSVLRPHQSLEEVRFPHDKDANAAHFCVRDQEGKVVGAVSVWPEAPPWTTARHTGTAAGGAAGPRLREDPAPRRLGRLVSTAEPAAWRLRAMATAPELRGAGLGSSLLLAVINHVAAAGGGLLWCNARLAAVPFYRRGGIEEVGEPWEEPVIGAHIAMQRLVGPVVVA